MIGPARENWKSVKCGGGNPAKRMCLVYVRCDRNRGLARLFKCSLLISVYAYSCQFQIIFHQFPPRPPSGRATQRAHCGNHQLGEGNNKRIVRRIGEERKDCTGPESWCQIYIYDSCGKQYQTTPESFVGSHGEDDHK